MGEPLKLIGRDAEDLAVIAACLQDALVPLADMAWLADENRFVMVLNRFRWEESAREDGPAGSAASTTGAERTHGMLSVQGVRAVQLRGIDQQRERGRILDLLALTQQPDGTLRLDFAGGPSIRLDVAAIDLALIDLGEPWPTRWHPSHEA